MNCFAAATLAILIMITPSQADTPPRAAPGGGDRYAGPGFATRAPVIARHGMAATAQPLATQVAIDILKAGGSAIDAAIAANAALGLMEPVGCGIGGDLYAIVWDPKTGKLYGFNGSGRSPAGRSLDDLRRKERRGHRHVVDVRANLFEARHLAKRVLFLWRDALAIFLLEQDAVRHAVSRPHARSPSAAKPRRRVERVELPARSVENVPHADDRDLPTRIPLLRLIRRRAAAHGPRVEVRRHDRLKLNRSVRSPCAALDV